MMQGSQLFTVKRCSFPDDRNLLFGRDRIVENILNLKCIVLIKCRGTGVEVDQIAPVGI